MANCLSNIPKPTEGATRGQHLRGFLLRLLDSLLSLLLLLLLLGRCCHQGCWPNHHVLLLLQLVLLLLGSCQLLQLLLLGNW